jgi:hypothetical protein
MSSDWDGRNSGGLTMFAMSSDDCFNDLHELMLCLKGDCELRSFPP